MTPERSAQEIFGERAAMYTTSTSHTDPQVLARLVQLARPEPDWRALDIATGTGHTAFALAPHVREVVALDLTPEMLREGEQLRAERGITNVVFLLGDAHDLPFPDASFNLVVCRRAAHHFTDIDKALDEMRRVLCPGGRLVIDDRSVPEDDFVDACMNRLDIYHDRSHVRQYRAGEWITMVEKAGFTVDLVEPFSRHRPLSALTDRVCPEDVALIHQTLADLTPEQQAGLNFTEVDGIPHLNHWFLLLAAHVPAD